MDQTLLPIPSAIYSLATGLASLLFLICYMSVLITHARKTTLTPPAPLPVWVAIMYPSWLDRLTFPIIVKASVQALVIAIVLWTVLMAIILGVLAMGYHA